MVDKSQTARAVAANNLVNSFAMVGGSALAMGLNAIDVSIVDQLLLAAAMSVISAYLGWVLYCAERRLAAA